MLVRSIYCGNWKVKKQRLHKNVWIFSLVSHPQAEPRLCPCTRRLVLNKSHKKVFWLELELIKGNKSSCFICPLTLGMCSGSKWVDGKREHKMREERTFLSLLSPFLIFRFFEQPHTRTTEQKRKWKRASIREKESGFGFPLAFQPANPVWHLTLPFPFSLSLFYI